MERILLVDNEAGDRRAAARALGVREQELEAVDSIAAALVRAAEAGHGFVLVTPAQLEASLGSRPSSSADLLRETFDVFEDGVCLLARDGALKVANAIGERLFESALKAELQGVASEASRRGATADRCLTRRGGRSRRAPIRCPSAASSSTSATRRTSASARSDGCSRRSWRRSGCWRPASRTRSTTRRRSCWPTSRR
jgi:hypothetical protein